MRGTAAVLLGLGLVGCGPVFSGKVSGYTLEARESLFTPITDREGAAIGGLIVLSDQRDTCPLLAAAKAPPNATMAVWVFERRANGKALSPDVGDYIVSSGANASAASFGVFIRTDANGTSSIPDGNRVTTSGKLEVQAYSADRGVLAGTFEGKFGAQNDAVYASISATRCGISTESLGAGFLSRELARHAGPGTSSDPKVSQSADCVQMLSCYRATYGAGATQGSLESSYGPAGTCWQSAGTASSCTSACQSTLASLRSSPSAPAACFQ